MFVYHSVNSALQFNIIIYFIDVGVPAVVLNLEFGQGEGPIFFNNLECKGSEKGLLECRMTSPLGISEHDHSADVGIICPGKNSKVREDGFN